MNDGRKWATTSPVGKRGLMAGLWLVDPDGNRIARFADKHDHVARQCAAAMNLTTAKQRTELLALQAGYK